MYKYFKWINNKYIIREKLKGNEIQALLKKDAFYFFS